jgi:hypothetical protein
LQIDFSATLLELFRFFAMAARISAVESVSFLPLAASRTSCEIFMEQNFGPHMEQKCATLAPSAGRVSS